MSEETRARLALFALATGLASAVAYVVLRGYVFARFGPALPVMVVRTSTIAYYQALAVAAAMGLCWGLFVLDRASETAQRERVERVLLRVALPTVLVSAALCWAWP